MHRFFVAATLSIAMLAPGGALAEDAPNAPDNLAGSERSELSSILRPTLLTEVDYRVYPADEEGLTGFALAHLRPGMVLEPTDWFRGVATLEFASKNPAIVDAYAEFRANDWLDLTLGYSKVPLFASFVNEPLNTMVFPDRAAVINSFSIGYDLGAGARFRRASLPLEARLRIGNGTGSALGNNNSLPAGYASLDLVLGRAHSANPDAATQTFGLRLGAAGLYENTEDRNGISGHTPPGFKYHRPPIVHGARAVGEAHLVAYAGPVRLSVEGAMAREDRSRDTDGNPSTPRLELPTSTSYGLSTEVLWTLIGQPRQVGQAPTPDANSEQMGALEVAARYDGLWLGRGADDLTPGGSQSGSLALVWWPTDFLSAKVSGYYMQYEKAAIERPDALDSWGALARASFFWGY